MSVLRFATEEALRFSITSGLVPERVLASGARTWRDGEGGVIVVPDDAMPPDAMKKLAAAGVGRLPASTRSADARAVRCWPEILSVVRSRDVDDSLSQVLFVLPDGASLVDLAGELIRLGCDRIEWRTLPDRHLVRVAAPPYYSLLRAVDAMNGIRAYAPFPKGQDRIWVEIGYEHPLAHLLRPEAGSVLLVSGSFDAIQDGDFSDIYSLVDLEVPGTREERRHEPLGTPPRLPVTLRLARAASAESPSLWVLRENAITKVERLLASLPEEIAQGLLFSPCVASRSDAGDNAPNNAPNNAIVVIRARPGTRVTVEIEGEAYRAHPTIANLFLPCDASLEPPLRRDRVRELLAPNPDDVVWLRALGGSGGGFQVERASDEAFHPLSEWVEYVIDRSAPALVPWVKSCTFEFDSFIGIDEAPVAAPERPEDLADEPRRKVRRRETTVTTSVVAERAAVPGPPQPVEPTKLEAVAIDTNRIAEELSGVEKTFLALEAAADDPLRTDLWGRMASLNARLRRDDDAALCWARVVWELPAEGPHPAKDAWLAAEKTSASAPSARSLLETRSPSRDHVRQLAVLFVAESDPDARDLAHDAMLWLDRHDASLDLRTAWLARVALSRLVGGDRLGLARVRDRLLAKLHGGLSLERDVPSFMRRAGTSRDAAQSELISRKVDALVELFDKTPRKRSATEAPPKLTGAYVRFIVAYGAARLGRAERATELRDAAIAALPKDDPVHELLARAYVARIGQALEALPWETPLPAEISASLNALTTLHRYKADRVRQCSKVLEPHERLDPIRAFQRGEADPRGPEFAELRGASEREIVESGVAAIMAKAKASAPDERARLYDGVMDFFPSIAHERAIRYLETILGDVGDVAAQRRIELLEEALMLAGHLGEEALGRKIFGHLEPLVASVGPDGAAEIAPLASGMLRTLRRFGLRDEAQRLLGALQAAANGKATAHLVARLHTAAAFAYLGEIDRARPVFEEALGSLRQTLPMPARLQLVRALARALGAAPIAYAMAGLDQLQKTFDVVTDSFNTNSHVCLSVLDFIEALVLGYVNDDLAVDPIARRFLDDDEYLVRRRIHRDLSR